MNTMGAPVDPRELEAAFSLFNEASRQLAESYADLQKQVVFLTTQLEIANGALRNEFNEKSALSRRLTLLLDRLPAGVVELHADGSVAQLNTAALGMLGDVKAGDDWARFAKERMFPVEDSHLFVCRSCDVERRLSIIESDIPEENIRILLIHDLTEFWLLQQSVIRHQKLASMGEMAAGLAHQLRTPLSTALLYTGHLARPSLRDEDRIKFAEKSLGRLRHLEVLISNMLSFVRGHAHELEVVSLSAVLDEAIHTVQPHFDAANVLLTVSFKADNPKVRVNAKEMVGVLLNLLDNALKASQSGQSVEMGVIQQNQDVLIGVKDDGVGMGEEVLSHLFEPFFTTRKGGTGLGLAVVRNLVALYGGDIEAKSTLGQGSLLQIRLPLTSERSTVSDEGSKV